MNDATPRSTVEGSQIGPHRTRRQGALFHASRQYRGGIRFDLDVADDASAFAQRETQSELDASVAGAEGQHVDGR
jgi:hypothetical protein